MVKVPRIVRDVSYKALGSYGSAGLQMLRGLLLAGLLAPADLGTVAIVGVVLTYSLYADLGMASAVGRELPLAAGAGSESDVRIWPWYAIVTKLVAEAVVATVLLAYVLLRWSDLAPSLRFCLLTAVAVTVLQGFVVAQQIVFDASRQFGRGAALLLILFGPLLVTCVAGGAVAGTRGVFVGQVIAFAMATAAAAFMGGWPRPVPLQRGRLALLLKVGFPLMVLGFAGYNLVYVDQIMVIALLGRADLGVYMLPLYAGNFVFLVPQALAGAVGPRLIGRYGAEGTPDAIAAYTWVPVRVLSLALPPVIAALWLLGPVLIVALLPRYVGAIGPLRIYLAGMFFLGLNYGVSTTLLALNKHRNNIPIVVGAIGLNVALDLLLVGVWHLGLNGIAMGSALTYAAYWMAHTILVRWYFGQRPLRALLLNLASGWPGFALAGLMLLVWGAGDLGASAPLLASAILAGVLLMTALRLGRLRRHGSLLLWPRA